MSYNVVITENFKKEVKQLNKKYRSIKADINELIDRQR